MKRILSVTAILTFAFLLFSAFSIRENPQDPPRGKKVEKHIKMVKVDENGNKVELDTIIKGGDVFVWNGDTVGGAKELKWITKDDFVLDSLHENMDFDFDFDVEKDGEGNVFIMKSGKGGKTMVKEFKIDGDSDHKFLMEIDEDGKHGDNDVMMWHGDEGNNEMIFRAPKVAGVPHPPNAPNVAFFGQKKSGNVIDLSDPGIISYNKKKMKNGTEKITIIRKEVPEENIEFNEEIMIHGAGEKSMIWHERQPKKAKSIKVIRSDDGKVEIIEDENIFHIKKGDARVKVIEEDGKIIRIKEIKEGGEKKVEVKVEVEEEKKENN
ncbi:MAG: hypothetical protein HN778_05430 [Prolixibacteraceae bacterium]|jgi:hypothetical protein|nr:hypothetical protein [Prolixibacteraceae bacterium]MBT6007297.1 hypothetical protein [Prolixibacteraceae bacterium]MBT6764124.1 hypothetical protein [Prolixibacteraceae bacterium]MBT6998993.1 hypothetical protein [Prolixibacteraceae bacterium]MBT7394259.1 hypothetical protein [Prolixibacteraceae bacterium]